MMNDERGTRVNNNITRTWTGLVSYSDRIAREKYEISKRLPVATSFDEEWSNILCYEGNRQCYVLASYPFLSAVSSSASDCLTNPGRKVASQ